MGTLLLTWLNFPTWICDHMPSVGWNYISIPKLQRLHRCRLGMDKYFHPTHHNGCDSLFMVGLKLIHVSERGPWPRRSCLTLLQARACFYKAPLFYDQQLWHFPWANFKGHWNCCHISQGPMTWLKRSEIRVAVFLTAAPWAYWIAWPTAYFHIIKS